MGIYVKVKEYEINFGRWFGGFTVFDYQIAFGMSVRRWCTGPAIRIYFGPFKLWLTRRGASRDA